MPASIITTDVGNITFVQHYLPPLEDGQYTINVSQTVENSNTNYPPSRQFNQSFGDQFTIFVKGERTIIDPTEIYSFFPPANVQGSYDNCLPHLIFTSKTLPWERLVNSSASNPLPNNNVDADQAPWLALMHFDQADPPPPLGTNPTSTPTTIGDLLNLPGNTFFPPEFKIDHFESTSDPCNYIDVPVDLFNAIAPTLADLPFLAHARQVNILNKATKKTLINKTLPTDSGNDFTFSVLMSNRLPTPGHQSTVHLVSLEEYGPYLPNANNSSNIPANGANQAYEYVRLITFKSWGFSSLDQGETFKEYMENLNSNVLQQPNKITNPQTPTDQAVTNAFNMGYVPVNQFFREGSKSVAWYKGPLAPFLIPIFINIPIFCADAANFYNPDTGMFDGSYSAAWQLGQLLGLYNKQFATCLYNWRKENYQTLINQVELATIKNALNPGNANEKLQSQLLTGPIKTALANFTSAS